MRKVLFLFVCLSVAGCAQKLPELPEGTTKLSAENVAVTKSQWVDVQNPTGIENANAHFLRNEYCIISSRGGLLSPIAQKEDEVLVEYSINGPQFGTSCPDGTLFWIYRTELYGVDVEKEVRVLLGQPLNDGLRDISVSPEFRWVEVVNTEDISHINHRYSAGEVCSVEGGTVRPLGKTQPSLWFFPEEKGIKPQVLLIFETKEKRGGAQCPNGTLFFLSQKETEEMGISLP